MAADNLENKKYDTGDKKYPHEKNGTNNLQTMALNSNKAGMEGLDMVKINEIIKKSSEGSKFYEHKKKCQARIDCRIDAMKLKMDKISGQEISRAEDEMDKLAAEMEITRDLSRIIVHIDMDMFYAAVEMRDDPTLRNKPMAVGSTGMLSTSNYAARKYGIRAGMPGFIGLKLCPSLVIVPTNFKKYKDVSKVVQSVFELYDPNFSPMSLDEAYLDITNYANENGHFYTTDDGRTIVELIVEEIRRKVEETTTLTASAGIAANCSLAKVCSDMNKPNGQYFLPPKLQSIRDFVEDLPVRKVCGIGGVTEQLLKALDIDKCSDLWLQRGLLRLLFSENSYLHFLNIALGLGSTEIEPSSERERKSISNETTFRGTVDKKFLFKTTEELCDELADDMEKKEIFGRVVTIKIKTTNFEVKTRAKTLPEPTNDAVTISAVTSKLLENEMNISKTPLSLRLIGVKMSSLCNTSQMESTKKQMKLTSMLKKESVPAGVSDIPIVRNDLVPESECMLKNIPNSTDNAESKIGSDFVPEHKLMTTGVTEGNQSGVDVLPKESYTCPVCSSRKFTCLDTLNSHVDVCLNQDVVRHLVQESNSISGTASTSGSKRLLPSSASYSNKKKTSRNKKTSIKNNSKSSIAMLKFVGIK